MSPEGGGGREETGEATDEDYNYLSPSTEPGEGQGVVHGGHLGLGRRNYFHSGG